jgi:hypothetical protein
MMMGGPLVVEDSLDAQDMQELEAGVPADGTADGTAPAAGGSTRLLAHGGPQRVALASTLGGLTPVQEKWSPIPEE